MVSVCAKDLINSIWTTRTTVFNTPSYKVITLLRSAVGIGSQNGLSTASIPPSWEKDVIHPDEKLRLLHGSISVQVNTTTNTLSLWLKHDWLKSYTVSSGRLVTHETPKGDFEISLKLWDPFDYENSVGPGHADNQFGNLWLSLNVDGYGIHGTNDPRSIGSNSSRGCIRMHNQDANEVGRAVVVGSKVTIK